MDWHGYTVYPCPHPHPHIYPDSRLEWRWGPLKGRERKGRGDYWFIGFHLVASWFEWTEHSRLLSRDGLITPCFVLIYVGTYRLTLHLLLRNTLFRLEINPRQKQCGRCALDTAHHHRRSPDTMREHCKSNIISIPFYSIPSPRIMCHFSSLFFCSDYYHWPLSLVVLYTAAGATVSFACLCDSSIHFFFDF